jgi:hypothetical protein
MKYVMAKPIAAMATMPAPIPPTTAPVLIPLEVATVEEAAAAPTDLEAVRG